MLIGKWQTSFENISEKSFKTIERLEGLKVYHP